MKTAFIILGVFIALLFIDCSVAKKPYESDYQYTTPPSGVKVAENFYCDKTELTNIDWHEYMDWTRKIFGEDSEEYFATMPDTSVWRESDSCLFSLARYYWYHRAYFHYPVVGVTQQQAEKYSQWRSNRYFEYLLVNMGKLKHDTAQQTKDNYFTVERYFRGTINSIVPSEKVKYYPNFRLPTFEERERILQYADSVDQSYFENCNTGYCKECKEKYPFIYSVNSPCDSLDADYHYPRKVISGCHAKKGKPIYHLRGNVSEWTAEPNISAGGGWRDNRERILNNDTFYTAAPNSWTGFRNVVEWKKWEE